ncbi:hypothetical protein C2845_PM13G00500 [Panicum miliaceum]|uniref:Uncharacterized protein n=1 Tax=Panicum miliaceum TaxID=4540 RepID=A0A3L6RLR5_PANMI|nr:hypothetical protein C2845_PM13G00500 [Panicum miliaceum]
MSDKRRRQNQRAGGGHKRRRPRKHLYLVLDDWEKGFSIHKIDADHSFALTPIPMVTALPGTFLNLRPCG